MEKLRMQTTHCKEQGREGFDFWREKEGTNEGVGEKKKWGAWGYDWKP
jgi:hypothetical protein